MNRRTFLGAVLSGITVLALSACGASATPAEGTGSQALPPIMIEIGGESIVGDAPSTIKASDFVVFTGESSGWTVATTTPDIVSVVQGGTQDTYQTNPGFEAIKAGAAVVTITSPMGTVITLDITVE
ncbi:MAG: hypothetical protein RLY87_1615 [Chloroflexota bacterium]